VKDQEGNLRFVRGGGFQIEGGKKKKKKIYGEKKGNEKSEGRGATKGERGKKNLYMGSGSGGDAAAEKGGVNRIRATAEGNLQNQVYKKGIAVEELPKRSHCRAKGWLKGK